MPKKTSFLKLHLFFAFLCLLFISPVISLVSAHEAYVLTKEEFRKGLQSSTPNPLAPLFDPAHVHVVLTLTILVICSYALALFLASTPLGEALDKKICHYARYGKVFLRLTLAASFLVGALTHVVFGPELPLTGLPLGTVAGLVEFVVAILLFLGLFVQVAAGLGILLFLFVSFSFGAYLITYANYFGELLALVLFGLSVFSLQRMLWKHASFNRYALLEVPIIRTMYGVALIYAGYTIKFQHQALSILVYNKYHLVNIFHDSAAFIAAGAGISEISIGLFILIGFAVRFTLLISLIFITLSILYFQEMVWPHLLLYGISFFLFLYPKDRFTIDYFLIPFLRNKLFKNR